MCVAKKKTHPDDPAPRKSTKKLTEKKPRGKAMRNGWAEKPQDNPNGKEDFDNLLEAFIHQKD